MGPSLVTQHGAGARPPSPGNDSSPSAGQTWSKILAFGSTARPRLWLCQHLLEGVPLVPVPAGGDPPGAMSPCSAGGFAAAPQHNAPQPNLLGWQSSASGCWGGGRHLFKRARASEGAGGSTNVPHAPSTTCSRGDPAPRGLACPPGQAAFVWHLQTFWI